MPDWIWDPAKDALNRSKHRLPLAAGAAVLTGDALALSRPDPHPDGNRWQTIGTIGSVAVLLVVHTEPAMSGGRDIGRIISVRKATAHERRAYENGIT